MPKGYWIVHVDVRDPEIYQRYVKANAAAFAKYGARFLVRGGRRVVTRGKAAERTVVIEFRDYETAIACHEFAGISRSRQASRRRQRRRSRDHRGLRWSAAGLTADRGSGNGRHEADRQRRRRAHGAHDHPDPARVGRVQAHRRARARGFALARPGPGPLAGCPASGLKIVADPLPLMLGADAIIDFSSPAASVALAGLAAQARIVDVIGTTGLSDDDLDRIDAAARHAPIVRSGNMSVGVNLLAALTRRAASALGPDFDIEIVEMHHRMKVDAPSGTALLLGEAAAEGRGVSLKDHSARGRDGLTGARRTGDIGFASLRGGTVVGDHSVIFAGEGERFVLSHHAEDRALFARGALKAALWARDRKPGLYSMADVLGLGGD